MIVLSNCQLKFNDGYVYDSPDVLFHLSNQTQIVNHQEMNYIRVLI